MARFAANLTLLFTELPILGRFEAAQQAGFDGVEVLFPYDIAVPELRRAADSAGMEIVSMNCPPPNWAGGPRGFAAVPELKERFRTDFERALRFAEALSVRHIHIMSGKAEGEAAKACLIENLSMGGPARAHASLTIEPMNSADMPGYFLNDFGLAAEVLDAVGAPNLGLQFDVYHAHMITGDVLETWRKYAGYVRHIQIAGTPDRHEPREGDIDFRAFFRAVEESRYPGWVAAEYLPRTTTEAGLRWLPNHKKMLPEKGARRRRAWRGSRAGNTILSLRPWLSTG